MKAEPATLLVLTPGFAESEADTTCLPLQQTLIRNLKEAMPELNIVILSLQYPHHKINYKWYGMEVVSFGGKNKGGLSRLLLRQKLNQKLEEIITENFVMGVLSFWCDECALIGKRFADKHEIRHACWILGQDAKKENKYVAQMRPSANELLALSDFLQEEFEKNHGIRPAQVIPPGIDTRDFAAPPEEKDIDILGTGSLIPLKQYDVFIKVVGSIKTRLPWIKVVLTGKGPEKEKLEKLIIKHGLESTVTLTGELPHPEVLQLMQRTKLFLHTSSYEGFGVVCIEALYGGANVISFVRPVHREIRNWHIVATAEEMADTSIRILEKPETAGSSPVLFPIKDTVDAMLKVFDYREVMS